MKLEVYANDSGVVELRINGRLVDLATRDVDYCDEVGEVFVTVQTDDFADGGAWVYKNPSRKLQNKRLAK